MNIVETREGLDLKEFYKYNGDMEGRQIIRLRMLQISNEGETHLRIATNLITAIANLGGLYAFIMLLFAS